MVVHRFQGVARDADDKDSKALKGAGTYRLTVLANALPSVVLSPHKKGAQFAPHPRGPAPSNSGPTTAPLTGRAHRWSGPLM